MLENFVETDMFLNFSFSDFDFKLLSIKKCILQFFPTDSKKPKNVICKANLIDVLQSY